MVLPLSAFPDPVPPLMLHNPAAPKYLQASLNREKNCVILMKSFDLPEQ